MKILVANIGSTSFKYRLYEMPGETLLARGGVERIGADNSRSYVLRGDRTDERIAPVPNHAAAVTACLAQLADPANGVLKDASELAAIGFKAVHAKDVTGVQRVDDRVLAAMDAFVPVAPAHNPPYLAAMRQLVAAFPKLPLVAAFETGFHETIAPAYRHYAVPRGWADKHGVKKYGFHGASHRYIAGRVAELMGRGNLTVISCHLGGSSSIAAIDSGKSVGTSMGMSPQTGLPHNNRVGDFDVFALPILLKETGQTLEQLLATLANKSGLEGLGGAGNDLRDIETAADQGNANAQLAIDVFVGGIRDYLGSYMVRLGRVDAIVFTGGIGENSATLRTAVCRGLEGWGIALDERKNVAARGEARLETVDSKTALWTIPTNEELVVARQSYALLTAGGG